MSNEELVELHWQGQLYSRTKDSLTRWAITTRQKFWEVNQEHARYCASLDDQLADARARRAEHNRLGDTAGVTALDHEIKDIESRARRNLWETFRNIGDPGGLNALLVNLNDPSLVRTGRVSLENLRTRLVSWRVSHKIGAEGDEAERIVHCINTVLALIEKGDYSSAHDTLDAEWRRVVMFELPTTVVAWPVGMRTGDMTRQVDEMWNRQTGREAGQNYMRQWRLMVKQSYLHVFLRAKQDVAALEKHAARQIALIKQRDANNLSPSETASIERWESYQRDQSRIKSTLTRSQVAHACGGFFLPSIAEMGTSTSQYVDLMAASLAEFGKATRDAAHGAAKDEAIWLAGRADLVSSLLRERRYAEADKVADEVVRWILDVDSPLQHEPGLRCFGRLSEAPLAAPR